MIIRGQLWGFGQKTKAAPGAAHRGREGRRPDRGMVVAPTHEIIAPRTTGLDALSQLLRHFAGEGSVAPAPASRSKALTSAMCPNFMVRSIAESSDVRMPSFVGYMIYSFLILLPIFSAHSLAISDVSRSRSAAQRCLHTACVLGTHPLVVHIF